MPVKTRQRTDRNIALWRKWTYNGIKNTENSVDPPPRLCDTCLFTEEMSSWLSMFVAEILCQDEKPYPGSTTKHILAGIQRHLRGECNAKINFKDPTFFLLRKILDSRMEDLLRSEKKYRKNYNFCKNF